MPVNLFFFQRTRLSLVALVTVRCRLSGAFGRKIAKGLPSVKVLVNWGLFGENFILKKSHNAFGDFFEKKSRTMPKKVLNFLVSPGIVCYAEKRENLFGSVPWANRNNIKFCRTFGRTILVTSGVSKKKH